MTGQEHLELAERGVVLARESYKNNDSYSVVSLELMRAQAEALIAIAKQLQIGIVRYEA